MVLLAPTPVALLLHADHVIVHFSLANKKA